MDGEATGPELRALERRMDATEARDDRQDAEISMLKRVVFGRDFFAAVVGSLPAVVIVSIPVILKTCAGG